MIKYEKMSTKYHDEPVPLYKAIERGDLNFIREISDSGYLKGEMLYKTSRLIGGDDTPLSLAARNGFFDILIILLRKNTLDFIGLANWGNKNTWLHELVHRVDSVPFLEMILKEKEILPVITASLESQDGNDDSALHLAARSGNIELLKILLPALDPTGAPVINQNGNSWIHELSQYHPDQLRLLANDGLIPNNFFTVKDIEGNTCLHLLAKQGQADVLAALIDKGADVGQVNKKGETFLHLCPAAVIEKLIERKLVNASLINKQDNLGRSIMHYLLRDKNITTAQKLYELGGRLDLKNIFGRTPIRDMETIYYGLPKVTNQEVVEFNKKVNHRKFEIDEKSLRSFFAKQQLYFVFGVQKLSQEPEKNEFIQCGNYPKNIIPFLKESLIQFADKQESIKQKHYKKIINLFDNFLSIDEVFGNIDKVADNILSGQPLLTHTGWISHVVGVSIEKQGENIVLSLVERGPWHEKKDENTAWPVKTIRFKKDKNVIQDILYLLHQAQYADEETAKGLIFNKIPEKAQADFHVENNPSTALACKMFKAGICYYANFKTIIHDWFVKEFSLSEGQKDYKNFEVFLRKQAVEEYLKYVPSEEYDRTLLQSCKQIIKEKEEQVKKLTPTPAYNEEEAKTDMRHRT
ncbi:TPA: ankyrin repeat domain-containing protein [Legionella anisa]|uniref:ankyrin repeat domain-containing protein n=1 Tax=Legionella anisa TaxID=28082 RepID=UPI00135F15B5|nr:ankyrin repeat domain-containing protein [Legionella anisa]MCW8425377.1 ankyrin repeat domain-containing protein [Legionella anisa]MCW8449192.1 ankyrin repeat domain-containing protein [Legionella anisa]